MTTGMRPRRLRAVSTALLLVALGATLPAAAQADGELLERARDGAYSAAGLYAPAITRYDNGLTLITKHRPGVRNVSVRVAVGLGMAHYPCGSQHTPHFLEHMLFASVPGVSEQAFERRMFRLGASSNAWTEGSRTVYELDVFSGTAMPALELIASMLTDAELRRASFDKTRDVIWREMGGEPGEVQKKTLVGGPLASGVAEAAADMSPRYFRQCGEWHAGQDVTFEDVRAAYARHYVPERMVWTVVGDFDPKELAAWAEDRLAPVARGETPPPQSPTVAGFDQAEYTGFGSEPGVWIVSQTGGLLDDSYYARQFIAHLLDERLYARLRLDEALTYTPGAFSYRGADWGLFGLHAETAAENHDKALAIMREIIDELTRAPLPQETFRTVQLSLLRQWAQAVETNMGYAGHYVGSLPQYRRDGRFINDEVQVAALTPERVHEVARALFADERTVVVRDRDIQTQIATQATASNAK